MATNCGLCGRKIGMLENQYPEFEGDTGACTQCHNTIKVSIKPEIDRLIRSNKSQKDITEEIISKHAYTDGSRDYLTKYVDSVMADANRINAANVAKDHYLELQEKAFAQKATTGYSFEGYKIVEYKGIISGESVVGTGFFSEFLAGGSDLLGIESNSFSGKMRQVKQSSLTKLKVQSVLAGGNAVIGVDFDYLTFANNMIGISANGTAVVIEKIEK